ncbi:hypothetical protein YPPY54_2465, partial [Yersinia pestis PY-54]
MDMRVFALYINIPPRLHIKRGEPFSDGFYIIMTSFQVLIIINIGNIIYDE